MHIFSLSFNSFVRLFLFVFTTWQLVRRQPFRVDVRTPTTQPTNKATSHNSNNNNKNNQPFYKLYILYHCDATYSISMALTSSPTYKLLNFQYIYFHFGTHFYITLRIEWCSCSPQTTHWWIFEKWFFVNVCSFGSTISW